MVLDPDSWEDSGVWEGSGVVGRIQECGKDSGVWEGFFKLESPLKNFVWTHRTKFFKLESALKKKKKNL